MRSNENRVSSFLCTTVTMYMLVGWRCFICSGAFFAVFRGHFLEQRASCCELQVIWLNCSFLFVPRQKSATWILLSSSSGSWETCVTAFPPGCPFQDGWGVARASLPWPSDSFYFAISVESKNHLGHLYFPCSFLFQASWASGRKDCQYLRETNGSGRVITEGFWVHRIGDTLGRCCSELSNQNACSHAVSNMKSTGAFFSPPKRWPRNQRSMWEGRCWWPFSFDAAATRRNHAKCPGNIMYGLQTSMFPLLCSLLFCLFFFQCALRLCAFGQMHKVLGLDLKPIKPRKSAAARSKDETGMRGSSALSLSVIGCVFSAVSLITCSWDNNCWTVQLVREESFHWGGERRERAQPQQQTEKISQVPEALSEEIL